MTKARLSLLRDLNGPPTTCRAFPVAGLPGNRKKRACPGRDYHVRRQFPAELAHLEAQHPSFSQKSSHISDIHSALQSHGALKIGLGFENDNCSYLTQVVQALHRQYDYGLPISHSANRGWFWDVRPSQKPVDGSYQARSETASAFPWHTDCSYEAAPPSFFALQVLQADRYNGGTLSILKVGQLIANLSASTQTSLARPEFRINVPPEFIKNESEPHLIGSLLRRNTHPGGSIDIIPEMRYREDIIEPLTEAAKLALEELRAVVSGPGIAQRALHLTSELLTRGSIILLNNRTWLHARNEVKDTKRHLRRVRWDAQPFEPSNYDSKSG